jgi:hypothetical protein
MYPRPSASDPAQRQQAEARRQRDREALEVAWRALIGSGCKLCRDGRPGPRCAACILRGTRP